MTKDVFISMLEVTVGMVDSVIEINKSNTEMKDKSVLTGTDLYQHKLNVIIENFNVPLIDLSVELHDLLNKATVELVG